MAVETPIAPEEVIDIRTVPTMRFPKHIDDEPPVGSIVYAPRRDGTWRKGYLHSIYGDGRLSLKNSSGDWFGARRESCRLFVLQERYERLDT